MSKTDMKYAGDEITLAMVSEDTPCHMELPNTIEECRQAIEAINDGIMECRNMELYSKDMGWDDEVSFWRGFIQKNKAEKHLLMNRIKELGRLQKGYAVA